MIFRKRKTNKSLVILTIGFLLLGGFVLGREVMAGGATGAWGEIPIKLSIPIGTHTTVKDLGEYINIFYQYFLGLVGLLAVIMIIAAGYVWLTAAGNVENISKAKDMIISAVVGLALTLSSYVLLYNLNPALVELKVPPISKIEPLEEGDVIKKADICFKDITKECTFGKDFYDFEWEGFRPAADYIIRVEFVEPPQVSTKKIPFDLKGTIYNGTCSPWEKEQAEVNFSYLMLKQDSFNPRLFVFRSGIAQKIGVGDRLKIKNDQGEELDNCTRHIHLKLFIDNTYLKFEDELLTKKVKMIEGGWLESDIIDSRRSQKGILKIIRKE